MLGVPILGMSVIYGGNMTVISNASIPGSNINNKHHACTYHFIREAGAAKIVCYIYKPYKQNEAHALTKALQPHLLYNRMKTLIFNKDQTFQNRIKRNIKTSLIICKEALTGIASSHTNWLCLHRL